MADLAADEAFARRLQAEENEQSYQSLGTSGGGSSGQRSSQTELNPLMPREAIEAGTRITIFQTNGASHSIINARLNELATSRATVLALVIVNIPQVIAAAIVLYYNWGNTTVCTQSIRDKWNWWALISASRMLLYTMIVCTNYLFRPFLESNNLLTKFASFRNLVDAAGLIWFLVGNVWILSNDPQGTCSNPTTSPTYVLCLSMLIINYIQICLPCIIALCMIPVFCFCMPCLIRLLARLQNLTESSKGASDALINTIPTTVVTENLSEEERSCPICLSEMEVGTEVRNLPCNHIFHKGCVDEWLRVNASCPTCRFNIQPVEDEEEGSAAGGYSELSNLPRNSANPVHIYNL